MKFQVHNQLPIRKRSIWRILIIIQSISRKKLPLKTSKPTKKDTLFATKWRFLGIRIVRIFGQKYSRFEYLKVFE